MNASITKQIKECQSLPTLPAAAIAVLKLTESSETGIKEIADVIAKDPALSSKVLRVVNSGFYNINQKVSSISQAAALLGMHSLRTLVLGFSLANSMRDQRGGFNHLSYWRRTMYAAAAARIIAGRVLPEKAEDCFIAALLMDLGTLLLDQILGEKYGVVFGRAKTHADLPILETHYLGTTHAEVGGVLAEHWNLPESLRIPMSVHHNPRDIADGNLRRISEVIAQAGRCADVFVSEDAALVIASARKGFAALFQIEEEAADEMLCDIGRKTSELASLFDVDINSAGSYDNILEKASEQLFEISLSGKSIETVADADAGDRARPPAAKVADQRAADKRRANRMQKDGQLTVIPCSRGILSTPIQCRLKDISVTGLGLVASVRLEPLTQFIIQLPQPDGRTKSLLYETVRCDTSGGLTSIGAQLMSVLRPERHESKTQMPEMGAR